MLHLSHLQLSARRLVGCLECPALALPPILSPDEMGNAWGSEAGSVVPLMRSSGLQRCARVPFWSGGSERGAALGWNPLACFPGKNMLIQPVLSVA